MPKNGKKKRRPGKAQKISSKARGRIFESALADAYRRADPDGAYGRLVCIQDEGWLRDFEAAHDHDTKRAFRLYMAGNLIGLSGNGAPSTMSEEMMRKDAPAFRDTFAMVGSMMLTKILMGDEWTGEKDHDDIFKSLASVERLLPDKYYDADPSAQYEKHMNKQYADGFTSGLSDMIDWDKITKGEDVRAWCTAMLDLTGQLTQAERIEQMDERAGPILKAAVEFAMEKFPAAMDDAMRTICRMGIIPNPKGLERDLPMKDGKAQDGRTVPPRPIMVARPAPVVPAMPPIRMAEGLQFPLKNLPDGTRIEAVYEIESDSPGIAHEWMRPILGAMDVIASFQSIMQLRAHLFSNFDMADVAYAAMKLLAHCEGAHIMPGLAEHMAVVIGSQRFATEIIMSLADPVDRKSDKSLRFKPFEIRPVGPSVQAAVEKRDKDGPDHANTYEEDTGMALWQTISSATNIMPPPDIEIRLKWRKILREMGYAEREATALCGYIEGLKSARDHTLLTSLYSGDVPVREDYVNAIREATRLTKQLEEAKAADRGMPVPQAQSRPEDMDALRSEYEQRMQRLHSDAENRIQAERRRILKAEKLARHEAGQSEQVIAGLESENEILLKRLKRLESENRLLRDSVTELSLDADDEYKARSADGEDMDLDGDAGTETREWPRDIGSECKIRVFGGDGKWLSELSRRFPEVEFAQPWTTPNDDAVMNADIVIVNTFWIKHKSFWPIRSAREKVGKALDVFPSRGINACAQHIVDTYRAWQENRDTGDGD